MTKTAYAHAGVNDISPRTHQYIVSIPYSTHSTDTQYQAFKIDYVTEFNDLLYQWKVETGLHSTTRQMMEESSFNRIVEMGDKVIPLIIEELRTNPGFIFLALHSITKENPVPPSAQGRVNDIVSAWLTWAARNSHYAD